MTSIGPTFADELRAAGVPTNGFAWNDLGDFSFNDAVAPAVREQVAAVLAAHDPKKLPPPSPTQVKIDAVLADVTVPASVKDVLKDLRGRV